MTGKRIYPKESGYLPALQEGDYGRINQELDVKKFFKWWHGTAPDGSGFSLNPKVHKVKEHQDGTITVTPSIVTNSWHGWLKKGVWKSV